MCESCDSLTPEQRLEVLDAFEQAVCQAAGGGEIVIMPAWLSLLERAARRRANRHDINGNTWRCRFWDVLTGIPVVADECLRRLGLLKSLEYLTGT